MLILNLNYPTKHTIILAFSCLLLKKEKQNWAINKNGPKMWTFRYVAQVTLFFFFSHFVECEGHKKVIVALQQKQQWRRVRRRALILKKVTTYWASRPSRSSRMVASSASRLGTNCWPKTLNPTLRANGVVWVSSNSRSLIRSLLSTCSSKTLFLGISLYPFDFCGKPFKVLALMCCRV